MTAQYVFIRDMFLVFCRLSHLHQCCVDAKYCYIIMQRYLGQQLGVTPGSRVLPQTNTACSHDVRRGKTMLSQQRGPTVVQHCHKEGSLYYWCVQLKCNTTSAQACVHHKKTVLIEIIIAWSMWWQYALTLTLQDIIIKAYICCISFLCGCDSFWSGNHHSYQG